jgi:hypothetical protein
VISVGVLTPILVCFHKLEITPPSNFNQSCDGTRSNGDFLGEARFEVVRSGRT